MENKAKEKLCDVVETDTSYDFHKRSRRGKELLVALISSVVAIIILDLLLLISIGNPYKNSVIYRIVSLRHYHAGVNLKYNRELIDKSVPYVQFRVNSRGYIEPAFRFSDPDFSIVFLGGSTTECQFVQENLRFPSLISFKLEKLGMNVNSLNFARSGKTSHDSINDLLNHVIQDKPNLAVIMHATNDIGVLRLGEGYRSHMAFNITRGTIGKYILRYLSTKSSIFGLIRKVRHGRERSSPEDFWKGTKVLDDSEPFRIRMKLFVDICRNFNITPILMTQPIAVGLIN